MNRVFYAMIAIAFLVASYRQLELDLQHWFPEVIEQTVEGAPSATDGEETAPAAPVSYPHLTLPTICSVYIPEAAVSLQKKTISNKNDPSIEHITTTTCRNRQT